jgi:hypothetical protein
MDSLTTTRSSLDCQDVSDGLNAEWETLSLEEATMDVSSSGPQFAQLQAMLLEVSKGVTDSMWSISQISAVWKDVAPRLGQVVGEGAPHSFLLLE